MVLPIRSIGKELNATVSQGGYTIVECRFVMGVGGINDGKGLEDVDDEADLLSGEFDCPESCVRRRMLSSPFVAAGIKSARLPPTVIL